MRECIPPCKKIAAAELVTLCAVNTDLPLAQSSVADSGFLEIIIALAPFTFECAKSACPLRPARPLRIFGDFSQKDMRVAHVRMLTGVLKLDFWGSRKVAFTFGAFRSDICVRRVPCFDHLFRYFLREKFTFFRLL